MDMRKVRQKVSLREWEERIHARQLSGQTVAAWCEAQGLSAHAYYYWLRKLREEAVKLAEESSRTALVPTFLELEEPGSLLIGEEPRTFVRVNEDSRPLVNLKLPGLFLEVKDGVNPREVKAALAVLRSLCF